MRRTLIIAGVAIVGIAIASYLAWAFIRPAPVAPKSAPSTSFFARLFPIQRGKRRYRAGHRRLRPETDRRTPTSVPRLRQVSDQPVAGGSVFLNGDEQPDDPLRRARDGPRV